MKKKDRLRTQKLYQSLETIATAADVQIYLLGRFQQPFAIGARVIQAMLILAQQQISRV